MFEGWQTFAAGAASGAGILWIAYLATRVRIERAAPDTALLLVRGDSRRVALGSCIAWPGEISHRISMRPHVFEVGLYAENCVWTREGAPVEVHAYVRLRVRREPARILEALDRFGLDRISDPKVIREQFGPGFEETLHAVASTFSGDEIYGCGKEFRSRVRELVEPALSGFVIDELEISTFQKIPKSASTECPPRARRRRRESAAPTAGPLASCRLEAVKDAVGE